MSTPSKVKIQLQWKEWPNSSILSLINQSGTFRFRGLLIYNKRGENWGHTHSDDRVRDDHKALARSLLAIRLVGEVSFDYGRVDITIVGNYDFDTFTALVEKEIRRAFDANTLLIKGPSN